MNGPLCIALWLVALLPLTGLAKGGQNRVPQAKVTKGAPAKGPSDKTFSQTVGTRTSSLGTPDDQKPVIQTTTTRKLDAINQAKQQARADKDCLNKVWNIVLADSNAVRQVNAHGQTFLHQAAFAGFPNTVKFLLEHGADPRAKDLGGATPPDLAQRAGYPAVAAQIEQFKP